MTSILEEAKRLQETIVKHRRYLHENAEQHLDLPKTSAYVVETLEAMGYAPQRLGSSGVVAIAGGKRPGKVFLLRADMDALPILEESDLPYKCATGSMHACGHDFHTSMLLGAAQILKDHEDEIQGQVKLMFQPAEETLTGAMMMIENGVLENPKVDAAMMIHVAAGMPVPTGMLVFSNPDNRMAAADWFRIDVQGKGGHGAMPDAGVDPINVLAHIHTALQGINAREVSPNDIVALTVGQIHGGATSNIIPDTAMMSGTIRTTDDEVRAFAKQRLEEIATGIGSTLRAQVKVSYQGGCPCLSIDRDLNTELMGYAVELVGEKGVVDMTKTVARSKSMGSEDFACVAERVPSVGLTLGTGSPDEGYPYPVHHPKVTFNEDALCMGTAAYANSALEWLAHNS